MAELKSLKTLLSSLEQDRLRLKKEIKDLENNLEHEIRRARDTFEEKVERLERKAAKEKSSRQSMQRMLERVQNEAHNTDYTDVEQFVLDHLPWEMEYCKRCHAILDCFRANPACRNCGAR